MSVRLPHSQLENPWTDFHESCYCEVSLKSVDTFHFWLKSDSNNEHTYTRFCASKWPCGIPRHPAHTAPGDSPVITSSHSQAGARRPVYAKVIDPRQFWRHWRHSQMSKVMFDGKEQAHVTAAASNRKHSRIRTLQAITANAPELLCYAYIS
jgi:hypothetical protein